jgi:uncharacterized repeat protein (TIGR03803 family)
VFELLPNSSGGGYTEKVLYSFTLGTDGGFPSGGLIMDPSGNLYGVTAAGGNVDIASLSFGYGTVFELLPNSSGGGYTEKVIYAFAGGSDGAIPGGGLIADASGNLYGTTFNGGLNYAVCNSGFGGCGTVFKVTPTGSETVLYSFTGGSDGRVPSSPLIADAAGHLYGTTSNAFGTAPGGGSVFELSGSGFIPPGEFTGTPGKDNCVGMSISTLAHTYGGIAHAAKSLGYSSVNDLQSTVKAYCGGA